MDERHASWYASDMNHDISPLPDRLRQYRELRGLTQDRLASDADVSRATVIAIESGEAIPSLRIVARLATALGVTVADMWAPRKPPRPRARRAT